VEPSGPPALVVSAVTSLVIAGVAALWLGMAMLTLSSAFGAGFGNGFSGRGVFLLVNGGVNLALVPVLLRGVEWAQWAATAVTAWWVLYWAYQLTRATQAFHDLGVASVGFGLERITMMTSLGLLLLIGWAAATAALLWLPDGKRHFRATF
jgi:hypothetical protein